MKAIYNSKDNGPLGMVCSGKYKALYPGLVEKSNSKLVLYNIHIHNGTYICKYKVSSRLTHHTVTKVISKKRPFKRFYCRVCQAPWNVYYLRAAKPVSLLLSLVIIIPTAPAWNSHLVTTMFASQNHTQSKTLLSSKQLDAVHGSPQYQQRQIRRSFNMSIIQSHITSHLSIKQLCSLPWLLSTVHRPCLKQTLGAVGKVGS